LSFLLTFCNKKLLPTNQSIIISELVYLWLVSKAIALSL
jgi:hypothetical protein